MFWRFGFHNPSTIDNLLEKDDLTLEELLDEDDLLQECKAPNQKLIDYLRQPRIISQLLNYITSDQLDDRQRFKYPYVACEVLSCEIWAIIDSIIENKDELLVPFWQFLDRPPPLDPLRASYWHKVLSVLVNKKTIEMLTFIKAQGNVVEKILIHLGTSAIIDVLLTLIRLEESPEGNGVVVEWLSSQGLLPALVARLDPNLDSDSHSIAQQVISEIIRMSQTSSPESPTIGTNALITQLKSEAMMTRLVGYMLDPTAPNSTSTLINGVSIIIDLIRHNNSDYEAEQLMSMNLNHNPMMMTMSSPVNLGDMLKVLANRVTDFRALLEKPKSVTGPTPTTMGPLVPLGFERLKICELFAELLHCSNMSNLNMLPTDAEVKSGTANGYAVNAEGNVIRSIIGEKTNEVERKDLPMANVNDGENNKEEMAQADIPMDTVMEDVSAKQSIDEKIVISSSEPAIEIPSTVPMETDKEISNEFDSEDIINLAVPATASSDSFDDINAQSLPSSAPAELKVEEQNQQDQPSTTVSTIALLTPIPITTVTTETKDGTVVPVGDYLKMKFVEEMVIPTCLNLFFQFPWNNFLHYVVYDMIHQMFNGRMETGYNRQLVTSVFKEGQLTSRIVEAQLKNDENVMKTGGSRLGYMGHLTFIADEVAKLFERYPEEILATISDIIKLASWNEYVNKQLKETKERDRVPLGGQRPAGQEGLDTPRSENDDDDEDSMNSGSNLTDTMEDQFTRYLNQQRGGGLEDSDEEDEEVGWMGEFDRDGDADFNMRGTFTSQSHATSSFAHRDDHHNSLEDDFGIDSDEEEDNDKNWPDEMSSPTDVSGIPAGWTTDFNTFTPNSPGKESSSANSAPMKAWPSSKTREHRSPFDDDEDNDHGFGDFEDAVNEGRHNDDFSGFIGSSSPAKPSSPIPTSQDPFGIPLDTSPTDSKSPSGPVWTSFGSEFGEFKDTTESNALPEKKVEDPNVVPALRTKEEGSGFKSIGVHKREEEREGEFLE